MSEPLYVNKRGFKCVESQLAKTEGRDPQDWEKYKEDPAKQKVLPVKVAKYKED